MRFNNLLPHDTTVIYKRTLCYRRLPDTLPLAAGVHIVVFVLDTSATSYCTAADPAYLHFMSNPTQPRMLLVGTSSEQPTSLPANEGKKLA